ncbi:hypothetical protein Pcinc_009899 [Petrolisthes cinctipes]|uniref:Tubulin-folding cofactor D ARM repeats domain-containing protein n=1 Tax=Petrolisthes cinctipes TaxID=88211 RepID=A0AAE1KU94_PETCI|nr:hypothetical protein Pcinc_009899 [Petrolisthes cinctipes]
MRVGLTFLKPKVASWRYQRGNRKLAVNVESGRKVVVEGKVVEVVEGEEEEGEVGEVREVEGERKEKEESKEEEEGERKEEKGESKEKEEESKENKEEEEESKEEEGESKEEEEEEEEEEKEGGRKEEKEESKEKEEEEEEEAVLRNIEEIINCLLQSLKVEDTPVRWSAAKGLGRITNRLSLEFGDDIVASILQLLTGRESDKSWHGGCLALAELARRGLLLPERL